MAPGPNGPPPTDCPLPNKLDDLKKENTPPATALHPRNPHQGHYDFIQLQELHPPLQPFVRTNPSGQWTIDFADPAAVLALNTALLKQYYQVNDWTIPTGYLCPPVPGRADYIHHAADLLAQSNGARIPRGSDFLCLDLGTGANLIYPIIGIRSYSWSFLASESDPIALAAAQKIQAANPFLQTQLQLKQQDNQHHCFKGILSEQATVDLVVCNPPFYESAQEARRANARKQRNLKQKVKSQQRNFGGQAHELWCPGGERAFISQMIQESQAFAKNVYWFTSLVAKADHLTRLQKELEQLQATSVHIIPMGQGNKRSRILAWTFLSPQQQKAWVRYRWQRTTH